MALRTGRAIIILKSRAFLNCCRALSVWMTHSEFQTQCARRETLFRADLGVAGVHVGVHLLGQQAIDLADRFLKALSFKYSSLEMAIGHDASKALQR